MPIGGKFLFTIFAIVVIAVLCVVPSSAIRPGPDWFWRWGRNDPIRHMLFRPEGCLRKYAKIVTIAWLVIFLLVIWLTLPTK